MLNRNETKESLSARMAMFEQACQQAGLKLTHQRLEIFRELATATDHPSAETLHRRLRQRMPTLSLDTIYRTLASLEENGLITRVKTGESQARFEAEQRQHHHLVCERCHEIIDFQWQTFDDSLLPDEISQWGKIKSKNAILQGLCRKCLDAV